MEQMKKGQRKRLQDAIEGERYIKMQVGKREVKALPICLVLREDGMYMYCYNSSKYILIYINSINEILQCKEEVITSDIVWDYNSEWITEIIK